MKNNHKNNGVIVHHYDPVCRKKMNKHKAHHVYRLGNEQFLLCCPECQSQFESNQEDYMEQARRLDGKTNKQRG